MSDGFEGGRVEGGCEEGVGEGLTGIAVLGQVDGNLPADAPGGADHEGDLAGVGGHGGGMVGPRGN